MNYVFGKSLPGPNACFLGTLQDVEDDYELLRGVPRKEGFPESAHFRMSDDFPRNLVLEDFLRNQNKLLVVSERLRELLEAERLKNNEFIPVQIINHKGRQTKEAYYILHQITLQDCINEAESEFIENDIDPELFFDVSELVIDEARIDPDVALFRMRRFPEVPIFRRDLADRIKAGGYTGMRFREIEDWDGG